MGDHHGQGSPFHTGPAPLHRSVRSALLTKEALLCGEVCGSDEEDFGLIRPSIIKCLRGILQQYPENGQILKEIVQNAEDAGAKKVRFVVDWNTYGQDEAQMEHPGLKHFQGPALYSYNDAHFTAVDWKSLQLLQDSLKAKDIMKIGRFGLGFKSVYHLTELPSVLSGNFLGYFDPSETFFSKDGDLSTGKRYKFTKSPEIIRKFRHQFEPFDGKYSCKIDQLHITGFDGTLFRFPLRQEPTKLSESIHTEISMKRLYDSFISDAHSMLLFLHNVEDIELWSLAKGQSEPSLYYKVVASPDHRMKAVSNGRTRIVQSDQQTVVFPLEITTEQGCKKRTTHWLVSEVLGSTSILEKYKHQAIPVIGVAMPSLMQDTATTALKGQLFCYVPLSAPEDGSEVTGLPVHVNGTFSLSPDRHHIITPTAGQSWKTNSDLAWNDLLRSHLLPIAYRNLILEAVRLHSEFPDDIPIGMVMSAWPNQMKVRSEWQQMATEVMKELSMKYDVFHSDYEGGCWVGSSSAVLEDLSCDKSMQEILKKVALKCHLKVIDAPDHVRQFLLTEPDMKVLSPTLLSEALRDYPQECTCLAQSEKHMLLEYLLQGESAQLEGLPLLPTADDQFVAFTSSSDKLVYSGSAGHPISLLWGQKGVLLSENLSPSLHQHLSNLASMSKYQLRELDPSAVVQHLPMSIPDEWKENTPSGLKLQKTDPSVTWLYEVWSYLAKHFQVSLESLQGLPLLLDEIDDANVMIHRMNTPSFLLHCQSEKLDPSAVQVLKHLGFQMLISIPRYISHLTEQFLCPPHPTNVVDVLSQYYSEDDLTSLLDSADTKLKVAFQLFLSSCTTFTPQQVDTLVKLPLFKIEDSTDKFVSVSSVSEACLNKPSISPPVQLLDLSVKGTKHLAEAIGASILPAAQFLQKYVFGRIQLMSDGDVRNLAEFMNINWHQLKTQDETLGETLKCVPFVATNASGWACPMDLFNPNKPFLVKLFAEEDVFPASWMRTNFLSFLEEVGLKDSSHITKADLIKSANTVEKIASVGGSVNVDRLEEKADAILQVLAQTPSLMDPALQNISWLPELSKPQNYPSTLQWKGQDKWAMPCEIASKKSLLLTASVLSSSKLPLPDSVGYHLGSDVKRDVEVVTSHLKHILESYSAEEKHLFLPIVVNIYECLAQYNSSDIGHHLQNIRWVWHGDGFAFPGEISLKPPEINLIPYMYVLPNELRQMQQLFKENGVHEECKVEQLVVILDRIGEMWLKDDAQDPSQDKDLIIVQRILEQISEHMDEVDEEMRLAIPIPVSHEDSVRMSPLKDTTCAPKAAIFQSEASDSDHFVHPCISLQIAISLGIQRLESRIVGGEGLEFVQQFGQSESLVDRLRNILSEYQDGFSVPKELVQNADDAKATVVKFMWDERKNKEWMTHLLDPGMVHCQGAALWVYNDAIFCEQDYRNIISLGAGNKRADINKIGKFGLGFNSVYNLTDVPGFVSQEDIVIFDPHLSHLGENLVSRDKPGVRIQFSKNSRLFRVHKDQFQPFQGVFDCDIMNNHSFEGTLFRFPLRDRVAARRSEICERVYGREQMIQLLKMIVENAEDLLLFTQSVQKLEVYHLPEEAMGTHDIKKVFEVTKENVKMISSQGFEGEGQRILDVAAHNFHKCSPPRKTKMTHVISIKKMLSLPNELSIEHCSRPSQDYLISHWLGENESKSSAASVSQMGLTPLASVAMLVSFDDNTHMPSKLASIEKQGKVFCYLPLPSPSGLPVHINGSFSVHQDRCRISERSNECSNNDGADWNEALLMDAVAEAYIQLLETLDTFCQQSQAEVVYCDYWPNVTDAAPTLQPLVTAVYKKIMSKTSMPVVHRGKTLAINEVQFVVSEEIDSHRVKREIHEALVLSTATSVSVSEAIIKSFTQSDSHLACSIRILDIQHIFTDVILANLEKLPSLLQHDLILYALGMDDKEVNTKMTETNCISVDQDENTLKKPSELVNPRSDAGALYSKDDHRFPSSCFCKRKILSFLVELGLRERLSWEDLLERADSVKKINEQNHDAAVSRCSKLLTQMEDEDDIPPGICEKLKSTEFLPVIAKPEHHPLPWRWESENGEPILVSPINAYLSDCTNLVSASHGLVRKRFLPPTMKSRLGLAGKPIILADVMQQLATLIESPITKETGKVALAIYQYLGETCHKAHDTEQIITNLLERLDGKGFIFIKKAFYTPAHVCGLQLMYDCPPYLCRLPAAYSEDKVKNFFHLMGYRDEVSIKHIVCSLQSLEHSKSGEKLEKSERKLVIHLLEILSEEMKHKRRTFLDVESDFGHIFLPDWGGILRASTTLCFMDARFLSEDLNELDLPLTHEDLSPKLSVTLGVRAQKALFLESQCEALPFGQKEELQTRLRHIVDSYPFDTGILKEFLQNADDAGASEIHFILDMRTHKCDKIFSEEWRVLQGPALLIYNNKPFTKEDLRGIQNLGVGSKETDSAKTGQYGIGFNAIYHLTDVPCFITSSNELRRMCIFDPHCKYLKSAVREAPGGQFYLEKLKKVFPDVFDTFLPGLIPEQNSTLFRFPLRKSCCVSQIKKEETTCEDIEKLFMTLKEEAKENLLFLGNLKRIKLSKIGATGQLQQMYECSAELTADDEEKRGTFDKKVKCSLEALKEKAINLEHLNSFQVSYQLCIRDSEMLVQEWLITQQIGVSKFIDETSLIREAFESGKLFLSPRGGTAVCLRQWWDNADSRSIGPVKGKIYCMFQTHENTYVPVHINGHFTLKFENRRELWKNLIYPEKDYKRAWNELLFSQIIAPCYVTMLMLLREALVKDLRGDRQLTYRCKYETLEIAIDEYFSVWPSFEGTCKSMAKSVYEIIVSTQRPLLPIVKQSPPERQNDGGAARDIASNSQRQEQQWLITWKAASKGSFYLAQSLCARGGAGIEHILKQVLSDIGLDLILITKHGQYVLKHFQDDLQEVSPRSVTAFLRSFDKGGLCQLHANLPAPIQNTSIKTINRLLVLLDYCFGAVQNRHDAIGLPLLLTWDGHLCAFEMNNRKICTEWHPLFPELKSQFVHPDCIGRFSRLQSFDILRTLTVNVLAELLQQSLPAEDGSQMDPGDLQVNIPTYDWYVKVWKCIDVIVKKANTEDKHIYQYLQPVWKFPLLHGQQRGVVRRFEIGQARLLVGCKAARHEVLQPIAQDLTNVHYPGSPNQVETIEKIVALPTSPMDMLRILHTYFTETMHQVKEMHAITILEYILEQLPLLQDCYGSRELLRKLPIYKAKHGARVALEPATYVIPEVPCIGVDIWGKKGGTLFLDADEKLEILLKFLSCHVLKVPEFYTDFIFKHLEYFEYEQRMTHLKFIYDLWRTENRKVEVHKDASVLNIVKTLRTVPFVAAHGELHCACDFLDRDNEVYKEFEPHRLPPVLVDYTSDRFHTHEWHDLLIHCGMRSKCDIREILQYARQIERRARNGGICSDREEASSRIREQADVLIRYFFNHSWDWESHSMELRSLGSIRFICPSREMCKLAIYHDPVSAVDRCVSFDECYDACHCELVWTVAPVIDFYRLTGRKRTVEVFQDAVGMKNIPSVEMVIEHLQKLVQGWKNDLGIHALSQFPHIFKRILTFLSKRSLSSCQTAQLSKLACIPVVDGRHLVPPVCTVMNLTHEQEIWPYLVKLPNIYWGLRKFLVELGATQSPSWEQYIRILTSVYNDCGKDSNGAASPALGLYYIADRAMAALFQLLIDCKEVKSEGIGRLYLLSQSKRIFPAEELVLDDAPGFHERITHGTFEFVRDTSKGVLKVHIIKALKKLPESMQPRLLSEIVSERLCQTSKRSAIANSTSEDLQLRLHLSEFQNAIKRLISHHHCQNGVIPDRTSIEDMVKKIGTVTVRCVPFHGVDGSLSRSMETRLVQKATGEPIPGSRHKKFIFVEEVNESCCIYLGNDGPLDAFQLVHVAGVVNGMAGSILPESDKIIPLLTCGIEEISSKLDEMNILRECDDMPSAKRRRLENDIPVLGEIISAEYLSHLSPVDPKIPLFPGHIIAAKVTPRQKPVLATVLCYSAPKMDVEINCGLVRSVRRKDVFWLFATTT